MKLQATGEIDFRDIAGSFDVAVSCVSKESVCVCVGARAHTRAMNIAFRYLGRANCPRECLEAVLISCQSEFGIRHARLENAFDSFSISFSSLFPLCFGKGRERKRKRRERESRVFSSLFKCCVWWRKLDLNFAYDVILDWLGENYRLPSLSISLFGRQRSGDSFLEREREMKICRYRERESEKASGF